MKALAMQLLFVLVAFASCGDSTVHSGSLTLARNPSGFPEDFPPELIYPQTQPELLGELDTAGYWSPAQYAILLQTSDSGEDVVAHYLNVLKREGWQILQSRHFAEENRTVIVAESFIQQTATIVVETGNPARIKLYLKKSSDD